MGVGGGKGFVMSDGSMISKRDFYHQIVRVARKGSEHFGSNGFQLIPTYTTRIDAVFNANES